VGIKKDFTLGAAEAGLKYDTFQVPFDKNLFFKGNIEALRPIGFNLTYSYDLALKVPNLTIFGVSYLPFNNCWKLDINYRRTQIDKAFYFNLQINYDGKSYFSI
jgi:hypothetical protein